MKLKVSAIIAGSTLLICALCAGLLPARAVAQNTCIVLTEDKETLTITEDTCLDLNGFAITEELIVSQGVTLQLKDSQTDDYTVEDGNGYGTIGRYSGSVEAAEGYMLADEAGCLSAHRLNLKTVSLNLRPEEAGIYYQSQFGGDEVVKRNISAYGIAVGAGDVPNFADKTYTRKTDLSAWQTGTDAAGNSKNLANGTLLKNILVDHISVAANEQRANIALFCRAYVELPDGSRLLGDPVSYTLRQVIEGDADFAGAEARFETLDETQKNALGAMYVTYQAVMENWELAQISHRGTGVYRLWNVKDLTLVAENPSEKFQLARDIDADGATWSVTENFTGTFDGNGHAISNLVVENGKEKYLGAFAWIDAQGTVKNLHLENIAVHAKAADLRFIGTVAGYNAGTVKNCTATGVITGDQTGTESAYVFVGALVGKAVAGSINQGGTSLSVENRVTDVLGRTSVYTTTGLAAKVAMNFPDSQYIMRRLVGNYVSGAAMSGQWQDRSFGTFLTSETEQENRQKVVDYVHQSGTVKWTMPAGKTVTYYQDKNEPSHIHTQKFVAGVTYVGIPYAHTSSSLEQFRYYTSTVNGDGVRVLNMEAADAGDTNWVESAAGIAMYIGSDCSAALTMAWHKVSPILLNSKANGGVCLYYTSNMVPSEYNQNYYGFQKVGTYTVDDTAMKNSQGTVNTDSMVAHIIEKQGGVQTVYEAYARTKMGDMLISAGTAGHARMAAQDAVVIRNAAGTIDAAKSYFVTHEQGDGLYERKTTNSSWRINYQYTFQQLSRQNTTGLAKGSNGYYLPITMQAFAGVDTELNYYDYCTQVKDSAGNLITSPISGGVNGFYRIQSTKLTIKDRAGNVVYEKLAFQGTNPEQNFRRAIPGKIPMYMKTFFSDYGTNLRKGQTYTFTVEATNYIDVTNVLVDNQAFVY